MRSDLESLFRAAASTPSDPLDLRTLEARSRSLRRTRRALVAGFALVVLAGGGLGYTVAADQFSADPQPPARHPEGRDPSEAEFLMGVATLARSVVGPTADIRWEAPDVLQEPSIILGEALAAARATGGPPGLGGWFATFAMENDAGRRRPVWIINYFDMCVPAGPSAATAAPAECPSPPGENIQPLQVVVDANTGAAERALGGNVGGGWPSPCSRPRVFPKIVSPAPEVVGSLVDVHIRVSEGCHSKLAITVDGEAYAFARDPSYENSPLLITFGVPAPRLKACMSTTEFWGQLRLPKGPHTIAIEPCDGGSGLPETVPDEVSFVVDEAGTESCPAFLEPGSNAEAQSKNAAARYVETKLGAVVSASGVPARGDPQGICGASVWRRTWAVEVQYESYTDGSARRTTLLTGRTPAGWIVWRGP